MIDHDKRVLQVSSRSCGITDEQPVYLVTLANNEVSVELTNFGCIITAIYASDRNGHKKNIVAGYSNIEDYQVNPHYFGCVLGRYAGRIAGGLFELAGEKVKLSANDGQNHLHGGIKGFDKKIWKIKTLVRTEEQVGVIMEYLSEDGEEGYPGNLWVTIKYTLNHLNELQVSYSAETDKSTPINLSNHSYFNLSGFEQSDILQHELQVNAKEYTEKTADNIPTGNILPVKNTLMDFTKLRFIGENIAGLTEDGGFNHNYVLNVPSTGKTELAAILHEPISGRVLKVYTDKPGIQVYSANDWDGSILGPQGYHYQKHAAIALETQNFSNAPNEVRFPKSILHPGQKYLTNTTYQFITDAAF